MRYNTEIMEHMISHVPPQVPDQLEFPVCRYCCTTFSSKHQVVTHVSEAHSTFGKSAGDMVVCVFILLNSIINFVITEYLRVKFERSLAACRLLDGIEHVEITRVTDLWYQGMIWW